jgi:beta-lactamase regulating signal transducer with metallopeptidase domain
MISQLLLTFLLNAAWQIALIASLAAISAWILRHSAARHQHWVWVAALLLSFGVPLVVSSEILTDALARPQPVQTLTTSHHTIPPITLDQTTPFEITEPFVSTNTFLLSSPVALGILLAYSIVILYGIVRLFRALYLTRKLRLDADEMPENEKLSNLIRQCSRAISDSSHAARVCYSELVPVPITIGIFSPVVIVPKQLLDETNEEVLISAIGHELIHVQRRDYALNLFYELLFLLLSFHPAAALIRRRIRQTRELSCDELVAEQSSTRRHTLALSYSWPALRQLCVVSPSRQP